MKHPQFTFRRLIALAAVLTAALVLLIFSAVSPVAAQEPQPQPGPIRPIIQPRPQPIIGGAYLKSHHVSVTIDNQVAVTKVDQVFVNPGERPAEGTYLFPLPVGAAVSNLTMYINGQPVQAQLLDAQQAQAIYTETVRRLRDPALLQYVGQSAIQANVFP